MSDDIFLCVGVVIELCKGVDFGMSYVVKFFDKGLDVILKKVGEEVIEIVMVVKDGDMKKVVYEVVDLWFYSMVVLVYFGLKFEDVLVELVWCEGLLGLVEFVVCNIKID